MDCESKVSAPRSAGPLDQEPELPYGRVLITPSLGLLAVPYKRLGIRPAKKASRPAIVACFMAEAIITGSRA